MKFLIAFAVLAAAIAVWKFYSEQQLSPAAIDRLGRQCAMWIAEEYADGRATTVGDHWTKRGKHVFEILARKRDSEAREVVLCVADVEKGSLLKPSIFEYSNWR